MVVEDGTGIQNANSYVTIEYADSYFQARNSSGWSSLTTAIKESALIQVTDFIDNIFQWYGKKEFENQSLRFPRKNLTDYEGAEIKGVPDCLKQAVCDAAIITLKSELFQSSEVNGDVVSENITSLSFTYSKTERKITSRTLYDSINTKLRGLYKDNTQTKIISGKVERV